MLCIPDCCAFPLWMETYQLSAWVLAASLAKSFINYGCEVIYHVVVYFEGEKYFGNSIKQYLYYKIIIPLQDKNLEQYIKW